uniref:Putative DNA binding, helix-turn-helix domain containing protein n=1 Tax=viral metagenome TaxID=1070528 RepID=A0A6M3IQM6_9ZZZZ
MKHEEPRKESFNKHRQIITTKYERTNLLLRTNEAAKWLGVSYKIMRQLVGSGVLRAVRSSSNGIVWIYREDLLALVDAGKKVALYVNVRMTDEDVARLSEAAAASRLVPVFTIRESLPDIGKAMVERSGLGRAVELTFEKEIRGIVADKRFLSRDINTLQWLVHLQKLGFVVWVEEEGKVTRYPYNVEAAKWRE